MLIFDIGTNLGEYTQHLLGNFPNCVVVCVEPQKDLANHLKNIFGHEINEGRIIVHEKAASNEIGMVNLYPASDHSIATTSEDFRTRSCFAASEKLINGKMFKDCYEFFDPVEVETTTIDSLIDQHGVPDFLKLDVEGYEYEALLGLTQKVPVVTFEWHEPLKDKVLKSIEHLSSIGFTKFSTEMWYKSEEYHDNEITDYKTKDEFEKWFTEYLEKEVPHMNEREWTQRSGMVWAR